MNWKTLRYNDQVPTPINNGISHWSSVIWGDKRAIMPGIPGRILKWRFGMKHIRQQCLAASAILLVGYCLRWVGLGVPWMLLSLLLLVLLVAKISNNAAKRREEKLKFVLVDKETSVIHEDAGWLNKLIAQIWPQVVQYVTTNVKQDVEDSVREAMDKYKLGGDFRFKRLTLGSNPIRLGGIEVLDQDPGREEVVIFADIEYKSDCEILFIWRGISGGIKDFQVRGRAKVLLWPIINSPPFVSNFIVTFPEKPIVHYRLSGVGLFLDIPGLRDILHNIITKKVANFFGTKEKTAEYDDYDKRATMPADWALEQPIDVPDHGSAQIDTVSVLSETEKSHLSDLSNSEEMLTSEKAQKEIKTEEVPVDKPSSDNEIPEQTSTGSEANSDSTTPASDHIKLQDGLEYNPIPKPDRSIRKESTTTEDKEEKEQTNTSV